jgi:hypothetical protein
VTDAPGMTIAEAMDHLDPPIPRRTLERRMAKVGHLGVRRPVGKGRPAKQYRPEDIYREHTAWATSNVGKHPTQPVQENP